MIIRQAVGIRTLIELVGLKDTWIDSLLYFRLDSPVAETRFGSRPFVFILQSVDHGKSTRSPKGLVFYYCRVSHALSFKPMIYYVSCRFTQTLADSCCIRKE
jgi:hypothetical protein